MSAIRVALLLAPLALSRAASAQEIPAFHAGQWGAEFTGGNWTNAGVMRFFSPRSVLVLSASGSYSRNTATTDGGNRQTSSTRALSLALGMRRYSTVASRVVATNELGAYTGFSRSKTSSDWLGAPGYFQSQSYSGIYGEIGGQYLVTAHLALGTGATLAANVNSGRSESTGNGTDYHGFSISTQLLPIRVSLYF
jgi:hypothetical protein